MERTDLEVMQDVQKMAVAERDERQLDAGLEAERRERASANAREVARLEQQKIDLETEIGVALADAQNAERIEELNEEIEELERQLEEARNGETE